MLRVLFMSPIALADLSFVLHISGIPPLSTIADPLARVIASALFGFTYVEASLVVSKLRQYCRSESSESLFKLYPIKFMPKSCW
ncbi:hypothetical protein SLA2020_021700 [Shorea laevis]